MEAIFVFSSYRDYEKIAKYVFDLFWKYFARKTKFSKSQLILRAYYKFCKI